MSQKKNNLLFPALYFTLLCAGLISSCDPNNPNINQSDFFEKTPLKGGIEPGIIDEASGIAASARFGGYLWTLQDSGQPASVYLLSRDDSSIREFTVPGAVNHDWEDIACGRGTTADSFFLYIGDIGNNNRPMREVCTIYRVPEIRDAGSHFDGKLLERIQFRYEDGPRDSETLLLDPVTRDIFIVSKETTAAIYRLAFPQSTDEVMTAERLGIIPGVGVATGGDISTDGSEIIIRTYLGVYYWKRSKDETVAQSLSRKATRELPVELEPQGEGICFGLDAKGFYTLSERANAQRVTLNYYRRK